MADQETSRGDWADTTFNPCSCACWQAIGPIVSIQCNLERRDLTAPPVSPVGAICLCENPRENPSEGVDENEFCASMTPKYPHLCAKG